MLDTKNIFPIGMGTWGVGGFAERDFKNDDPKQIKAMSYMLAKGFNFIELCNFYAEGWAVKLFREALIVTDIPRSRLFLCASIYPYKNETLADARKEFDLLLDLFETNYIDTVQFTTSGLSKWGLDNSIEFQKNLLESNLVRFISVTNANLEILNKYKSALGNKFFSHELHFSFEIRENEDFGLTKFADDNGIRNVIFQPIRRNKTAERDWPLLTELSKKYKQTQNQIIFNWIISRGYLPVTKSEQIKHIDEVLDSLNFDIDKDDIERLNNFRPPQWVTPKIDWLRSGNGILIHQLPNIFDEEYDKLVKSK